MRLLEKVMRTSSPHDLLVTQTLRFLQGPGVAVGAIFPVFFMPSPGLSLYHPEVEPEQPRGPQPRDPGHRQDTKAREPL